MEVVDVCLSFCFFVYIYLLPFSYVFFFSKIFGGHESFLWGHWYPYFGLLVTSPLGFKARVGSALFELSGGIRVTLHMSLFLFILLRFGCFNYWMTILVWHLTPEKTGHFSSISWKILVWHIKHREIYEISWQYSKKTFSISCTLINEVVSILDVLLICLS